MIDVPAVTNKESEIAGQAITLLRKAKSFVIKTDDDMERVADAVKVGNALLKKAEEERLTMTKPFRDGVDAINKRWQDQVTTPLKEALAILKEGALAYRKKAQEAAQKALREAEEAAAIGDHQGAVQEAQKAAKAVAPVRGSLGSTLSTRKTWTYDVLDINKVPGAYLIVSSAEVTAAIRQAVKDGRLKDGMDTDQEIPGLRIYQTEGLAVR